MSEPVRVLQVEDSEDDALLVVRELRRGGLEVAARRVDTVADLELALSQERWDIVLSDFVLPGFDALTVVEVVRRRERELPVVVVSGAVGEDLAVGAMRAGARDCVMKERLTRLNEAVQRELAAAGKRRLRERTERTYRALVDGSHEGLALLQNGLLAFVNPAAAALLGTTVKDLLLWEWEELMGRFASDDRSRLEECLARVAREQVMERLVVRTHASGGPARSLAFAASPSIFDDRPAIQVTLSDVTERQHHEREQRVMALVASRFRVARTRGQLISLLLDAVAELLESDRAVVALADECGSAGCVAAGAGAWSGRRGEPLSVDPAVAAVELGLGGMVDALASPWRVAATSGSPAGAGTALAAGERFEGAIWIGRTVDFTEADLRVLAVVAEIGAAALRRIGLFEELERSHRELAIAYDRILESWGRALELRDRDTEGHTRRVARLAMRLGRELGLDEIALADLRRGALLHDIGKIAIPDSILHKPGPLDTAERTLMELHPAYAREMLLPIPHLRHALDVPYSHHERWDGTGYPLGLRGTEIPLAARVFAVVDVWDALGSDRPYRRAWSRKRIVEYLEENAGRLFDPQVVQAFLQLVRSGTRDLEREGAIRARTSRRTGPRIRSAARSGPRAAPPTPSVSR